MQSHSPVLRTVPWERGAKCLVTTSNPEDAPVSCAVRPDCALLGTLPSLGPALIPAPRAGEAERPLD